MYKNRYVSCIWTLLEADWLANAPPDRGTICPGYILLSRTPFGGTTGSCRPRRVQTAVPVGLVREDPPRTFALLKKTNTEIKKSNKLPTQREEKKLKVSSQSSLSP